MAQAAAEEAAAIAEDGANRGGVRPRSTPTADRPTTRSGADLAVLLDRPSGHWDRAIVASAANVQMDDRKALAKARARRQQWQSDAWDYVDELAEVGSTLNYAANMMSKIRLFPAIRPTPDAEPVPVDDPESGVSPVVAAVAMEVVERLRSPQGGQAALLKALDWNLCEVAGEAWLHGHDNPETGEEEWYVRSVDEIGVEHDKWVYRAVPGAKGEPIPAGDLVKRLWDPHPRYAELATSPMRWLQGVCETLVLLGRAMRADAMTHLNSGFIVKSHELSFGAPKRERAADGSQQEDPFDRALNATLVAPVEDPGSAAAVAPGTITGPAEFIQNKYLWHLKLTRDMDQLLVGWVELLVMRLARGLNMPVEVVRGLADCVDTETQIRTPDGWRRYDEVEAGDEVLTLNHETGLSEWQRIERVSTFRVTRAMWSMEGRSHSSLSTLDHRWPVLSGRGARRWRRSESMKDHHHVICAAPSGDLPDEAKYDDAFVELVAWFWTEGCWFASGGAKVSQSGAAHPEKCDRIRRCLSTLAGPPSTSMHAASRRRNTCSFPDCGWPVHGNGLCHAHRQQQTYGCELRPVRRTTEPPEAKEPRPAWRERRLGNGMVEFLLNKPLTEQVRAVVNTRKVVDSAFIRSLTAAQLELFIDVSVQGDGTFMAGGAVHLHQAVEERTDAFELACLLAGRSITRREKDSFGGIYAPHWGHRFMVAAKRVSKMRVRNMRRRPVPYSGIIWCPTVRNGTWLARRNGSVYFTGNTTFANAKVAKKSEWDAYGEPRAVLMCDALTLGYFRERLVKGGVPRDVAAKLFMWYDPAGALAAPDPQEHAERDYEDGLISDEARRRAHGWSEADAPSDEERLRRLIFAVGSLDPSTLAQLLKLLGFAPDGLQVPAPAGGILNDDGTVTSTSQGGMAASAGRRPRPSGVEAGRRLVAIDRDLRLRLHVAAEQAMRRLLDRAGAKVRNKLGRSGKAAEAAAGVPNRELCARLGQTVVAAAGADVGDLIEGAFDDLTEDFGTWVRVAQDAALAEVVRLRGALDPAELEALRMAQEPAVGLGAEALRAGLQALAAKRLYDPAPGAVGGEADPAAAVPVGLLRVALGLAGGDKPQGGEGQPLSSAAGGPVGGVATGPTIMAAAGGTEAYVWDYGSAPRTPFPPHEALDGVTFTNFDDPVLANGEGWPPAEFFMPGDHDGCVCDAVPILLPADDAEE